MKKIYLYVLFVCLCLFSVFFSVCDVYAAENYTYYINTQKYLTSGNFAGQYLCYEYAFNIPDNCEVYMYKASGGVQIVMVTNGTTYYEDNLEHAGYVYYTNTDKSSTGLNHICIYNVSEYISKINDASVHYSFAINADTESVNSNVPYFDSKESLANYLIDGIEDGWLNKPEYDLSAEHDFNSDVWTPDIPVPELSKISHTGFTLENWSEDYYVDIIVNNHLSRIMMGKRYPSNDVIPLIIDSDPWYSEHYWNFTLHDVIPSRSVIDINEVFGVDIQGVLIEDFKNWSIEHPTINTVDRYNWTHIGQADEYLAKHVYKADGSLSDVEQLKNSGQAITEYYVRYFTLDGKYGQWGHYKLRDFSYNGQGELVDSGRVTAGTIDDSGKPSNTVNGSTDSNGNIDYTPIVDTNVDVNVGQLRDVLDSFANGVGQVPSLIAQVFSFLPWWINTMIAGIIAICITLRVLGR